MELYSIKITKSKNTPAEGKKGEWWQYEIFLGDTATVSGQRHGTREEVEEALKKRFISLMAAQEESLPRRYGWLIQAQKIYP